MSCEPMSGGKVKRLNGVSYFSGDWDESKHPRSKGGEFAPKGGGGEYRGGRAHKAPASHQRDIKNATLPQLKKMKQQLTEIIQAGKDGRFDQENRDVRAAIEQAIHERRAAGESERAPKKPDPSTEKIKGTPFTVAEAQQAAKGLSVRDRDWVDAATDFERHKMLNDIKEQLKKPGLSDKKRDQYRGLWAHIAYKRYKLENMD